MSLFPISVVDAFTAEPFAGNPAAVVVLDREVDDRWMTKVAAEMKHSETAFVSARGDGSFSLRWFTPEVEVDLCGHATLAAAHALFESKRATSPVTFHTRSGELRAVAVGGMVELDFPASTPEPGTEPDGLFAALGADGPLVFASFFAQVELADAATVRDLQPDLAALAKVGIDAVTVTARDGDDVVYRVFGPRIGIPEDPVTGAAQCLLAPYWTPRLGSPSYTARQLSARGGVLHVRLDGDRVRIAGHAVTVLEGSLVA